MSYALEGSIFHAGSVVQWLRDKLGIISSAAETEAIASSRDGNDGCYLVPAFSGLGAPWWDAEARGIIAGLTAAADRATIVRAACESMAYQSYDVLRAMERDAGRAIDALYVDGAASRNAFIMQFQADLLKIPVIQSETVETTALGAALSRRARGRVLGGPRGADAELRGCADVRPCIRRGSPDGATSTAGMRPWRARAAILGDNTGGGAAGSGGFARREERPCAWLLRAITADSSRSSSLSTIWRASWDARSSTRAPTRGTPWTTPTTHPRWPMMWLRAAPSAACSSAVRASGMAIAADKVPGVRASSITTPAFAELFRQHNNGNVVCLSGRFIDVDQNKEIVKTFLSTEFEGGRHERRVAKITALED